jgi:hypothetical protein
MNVGHLKKLGSWQLMGLSEKITFWWWMWVFKRIGDLMMNGSSEKNCNLMMNLGLWENWESDDFNGSLRKFCNLMIWTTNILLAVLWQLLCIEDELFFILQSYCAVENLLTIFFPFLVSDVCVLKVCFPKVSLSTLQCVCVFIGCRRCVCVLQGN